MLPPPSLNIAAPSLRVPIASKLFLMKSETQTVGLISTLKPFQWLLVDVEWPVSVPPVMTTSQPLTCLNEMIPSMVSELIWSNDVHFLLLRSLQLPLDLKVIPASLSFLAASS